MARNAAHEWFYWRNLFIRPYADFRWEFLFNRVPKSGQVYIVLLSGTRLTAACAVRGYSREETEP
jgi:hypothetical protein